MVGQWFRASKGWWKRGSGDAIERDCSVNYRTTHHVTAVFAILRGNVWQRESLHLTPQPMDADAHHLLRLNFGPELKVEFHNMSKESHIPSHTCNHYM